MYVNCANPSEIHAGAREFAHGLPARKSKLRATAISTRSQDFMQDFNFFYYPFDLQVIELDLSANKIADEGHYIHADDFRKQMNKKLKLGFGGTSWLDHASITWMMNGGMVIITTGVLLAPCGRRPRAVPR